MPGDILKTKKNPYNPYRCCVARLCTNTTVKTPEKLWISIPTNVEKRVTWLKLAGRDPEQLSANSSLYLCEDHFDLENELENYMRYKIMGSVKTVRIKPHHAPSRFDCWVQNGQSTSKPQLAESQNMVDITASSLIEDSHADVNNFQANNRNVPSVKIIQAQERNEVGHYKCVCCLMVLVKEKVRTLWQEQIVNGEMKIYGNMLADCFAFIWNKPEPSLAARDFICTCCIQRLEEAVSFKHQVMVSQQLINNMTFESGRHVMIETENQDTNIETDLRYDMDPNDFNVDCIEEEPTDPGDFNVDCIEEVGTNPDDFNDDCIKKEPTDPEEGTNPDDFNDGCIKKEPTDPDNYNVDRIKEEATALNDFNDDCESSDVNCCENICDNMCVVKEELEIDDNYNNSDGKSDGNYCEDSDEVHKDEDNPHSSNVEISVKVEDTSEGQPSVTDTSRRKAIDKENISTSNTQHSEDTLEADQNAACSCIEQIWLPQQSSIGDVGTEDHNKQMEVNDENPTIDHHVQDSGQIIRLRTAYNRTMEKPPDEPKDFTNEPLPSMSEPVEVQDAVESTSATPFAQPLIAVFKTKAQKQREYRQRIAASRTPAQAAAARKSKNERQRKNRLRQAANSAIDSGSLEATNTSSSSGEESNNVETRSQRQHAQQSTTTADQPDERVNLTNEPLFPAIPVPMEVQEPVASISTTPFAKQKTAAPKTRAQIQREYRQRIAASKTPEQAAAAREARNLRDRYNRLRQAANLAIASGSLEATTTSSRSGQTLNTVHIDTQRQFKVCVRFADEYCS